VILSWFLGACSKFAQIDQSGMHELMGTQGCQQTGGLGSSIHRTVSRHGEKLIDLTFTREREIELTDLDFYFRTLPLTCMRHIPDCHVPPRGRPLVHDLTHMVMSNMSFGTPVAGSAKLSMFAADNEELLPLQPREVLGGYQVPMAFRLDGVRVVHDYLTAKESHV